MGSSFVQIFVWSMKTQRLLDVLSGHEGPVHGLMFSPTNVRILSCFLHLNELHICIKYYMPNFINGMGHATLSTLL